MENLDEPNVAIEANLHRGQGLDWVTFMTFETGDFRWVRQLIWYYLKASS
jgi:hypothetical protein